MGKSTLYKNAVIITGTPEQPFISCGYLLEENGMIKKIGSGNTELPQADKVVDMHEKFLAPGMVCSHYHFYGQFARGMSVYKPVQNWQQMLCNMWWDMDRMLDEDAVYQSTMMGVVEGVKYGLTTYFDHQASPSCIDGSLDLIEQAMSTVGARGCLAYEVTDRNGKDGALAGIKENMRYIRKHANDNGKFKGLFGLHASYSLSADTLDLCASEANSISAGFHTHLAEDRADIADSYRQYNKHVVERMRDANILNDKTICAHVVHVRPEDYITLRDAGVTVAYDCQSNTNNAVGCSPVADMLNAGVHVAIGGDGYGYNMFAELAFGAMSQKLRAGTPVAFNGGHFNKLAFENTARLAEKTFGYGLGQLKEGYAADFIVMDYPAPTPVTENNYLSHFQSGMGDFVDDVYIGGKKVVENRKLINIDEKEVFAKTREAASRIWKRMETV